MPSYVPRSPLLTTILAALFSNVESKGLVEPEAFVVGQDEVWVHSHGVYLSWMVFLRLAVSVGALLLTFLLGRRWFGRVAQEQPEREETVDNTRDAPAAAPQAAEVQEPEDRPPVADSQIVL